MRKGVIIVLIIAVIAIIGVVASFLFSDEKQQVATEEDIIDFVQNQYEGSTIDSISKSGNTYTVHLTHPFGEYELVVDAKERNIVSLTMITLFEQNEKTTTPPPEKEQVMLSQEEAKQIALQQVNGIVEDIEVEEENGLVVYEVEIEINEDDDATVIINAYTGEIISVTID